MKKIIVLLFLSVMVLYNVFAGDLVKLTKWDEPLIFEKENFAILGTGLDTYLGDLIELEAAIENRGSEITVLKITAVYKDADTGFPIFQIEFVEMSIPTGTSIITQSFDIIEWRECADKIENITTVWSVNVWRMQ